MFGVVAVEDAEAFIRAAKAENLEAYQVAVVTEDARMVMEWNGAILNLADATVLYQDQKLELSKNEFKILQILLENTGKIVSRESIMTRLWDRNEFIDDNTLTVNVARLRKKMEQIGLGGKIITKKGIGYMVEA